MAGHSHFKNIKRKKEAEDQRKAAVFSKMSRLLISAAREKGEDPNSNPALRLAIEKAKEADMPKERINRAIARGVGKGEEGRLEPFLFEAYGPESTAFLIQGSTDNKNRDLSVIKETLKRHGGKLADPGSVKWLFVSQGIIEVENKEFIITKAIDYGVEEIEEKEDSFLIYIAPEEAESVKSALEGDVLSFTLGWRAKNKIGSMGKRDKDLLYDLENIQAVEGVYSNAKI